MDLNKGISTPIAILVIVVTAALVGGVFYWQYNKLDNIDFSPKLLEQQELQKTEGEIKTGSLAREDQPFFNDLQEKVDEGNQTWRLNPLQVAKEEGVEYGFDKENQFKLKDKIEREDTDKPLALVEVEHQGEKYILYLSQPAELGSEGIWALYRIEKKLAGVPVSWKIYRGARFEIRYPRNVSFDGQILRIPDLPPLAFMSIRALKNPDIGLQKRVKSELQNIGYQKQELKEFKISPEKSNWGVDAVKSITVGDGIPGYFVHSWEQAGKEDNYMRGICIYYGMGDHGFMKAVMMDKGLEYSTCLNNQTLNQILSSFRFRIIK